MAYLVFPALLGGTLAGLAALVDAGVDLVLAAALAYTTLLVLLVILERALPYERKWHAPDGQLGNDFAHTLLASVAGAHAGDLAAVALAGAIAGALALPSTLWPSSLPLAAQLVVAYLAIDFVRYWQHRAQHTFGFLWATHELHHDSQRLMAMKTGRSHVFDRAMQALCPLPLLVLGAPASVLFWCVAVNSVIGLVAHANVDMKLGFLGLVVVGPEQHRVHHAREKALHDSNFGASLMIWDRLFGTARDVEVRETGLDNATPPGLLAQLAAPVTTWLRRG